MFDVFPKGLLKNEVCLGILTVKNGAMVILEKWEAADQLICRHITEALQLQLTV